MKEGIRMSHEDYIGKKLKELYKDTPNYATNFYLILVDGNYKHFNQIFNNEDIMNKEIKNISDLHSDYTCYVELRK